MDAWISVFSASVLVGVGWSDSLSGHVIPGNAPGIHCVGGRMDLIADLRGWRKYLLPLPEIERRFLGRTAYSPVAVPA
jgi:hypothetical protein